MRTFFEFLEAARWKQSSWTPPAKDSLVRLKRYNKPNYFVHFSDLGQKLGVNPTAAFSGGDSGLNMTPYGIFAYQAPYVIQEGITRVPFGGDRPYMWVFTPRNPRKIKKIKAAYDKNAILWDQGKKQSYVLGMFHSFFLKRGVEGFVDDGTGTIHPSEPYQAVFFGSQTVKVVEVIENSYSKEVTAKFYQEPEDDYDFDAYLDKIYPTKGTA